jgi:hypothetical protein
MKTQTISWSRILKCVGITEIIIISKASSKKRINHKVFQLSTNIGLLDWVYKKRDICASLNLTWSMWCKRKIFVYYWKKNKLILNMSICLAANFDNIHGKCRYIISQISAYFHFTRKSIILFQNIVKYHWNFVLNIMHAMTGLPPFPKINIRTKWKFKKNGQSWQKPWNEGHLGRSFNSWSKGSYSWSLFKDSFEISQELDKFQIKLHIHIHKFPI